MIQQEARTGDAESSNRNVSAMNSASGSRASTMPSNELVQSSVVGTMPLPYLQIKGMLAAQNLGGRGESIRQHQEQPHKVLSDPHWNTENLGLRLGFDVLAATSAAFTIAPIITMIDRSIMENASGSSTIPASLRISAYNLVTRPHSFLKSRPFLLIFALYTGTYAAANTVDTLSSTVNSKPANSTTSGAAKFAATSTANLSLCVYKDSQFTKLFGVASARPVPKPTLALFALRDGITIFASFCLPAKVAPLLPISEEVEKTFASRTSVAQFLTPAACQLFSTPLHLLGLDLYNRGGRNVSLMSRARVVGSQWGVSCAARVARIVPAFGVGGVMNASVRRSLMERL